MPWVDKERCVFCGICVEKCPVNAISLDKETISIDMNECIRCGVCHEVCPQDAVRHDSETIPADVEANVARAKKDMELCVKYLGSEDEGPKCLNRTKKHYQKQITVAQETLKELEGLT